MTDMMPTPEELGPAIWSHDADCDCRADCAERAHDLIVRAIEIYDGQTGGSKDRKALGAALPENCVLVDDSDHGTEYVLLHGRTVQGDDQPLAAYEVIERDPELRSTPWPPPE
jgi:hypothetical protein